uniref:Reverse transcriptase domain-containing protein n=1 Tax=Tanacetum cinerariifolium TaxID=118510 RepID=A0A6L2JH23_TANCI|nr:hypothetical protein [Tanacetum cinerariifolium]
MVSFNCYFSLTANWERDSSSKLAAVIIPQWKLIRVKRRVANEIEGLCQLGLEAQANGVLGGMCRKHAQLEDTNELFQKLLEDLHIINEELAEYINSPSWNSPTFYNNDEEHSIQYKEYLENSSNAIAASNFNQEKEEPPQNFDIRKLIREECGIKVCEEKKKKMEDTMLELLEVCRQKEFYCMYNDVDDLIESALNFKLLSINLKSQCRDKEKQEVKNIVEHPTKHGTRIAESLHNFRLKKSSTSLNNTSQISPVNAIAPVLPTEEPEYSFSMGYEHPSTTPKTESEEVIKSSAKNLVPIPSEYEVTSNDESDDDESLSEEDVPMENFKVYSNPLFDDGEINFDNIDPHYFNAESNLIESLLNRDTLIDSSPKFDFLLKEFCSELAHINPILPGIKEANFDLEEEIRLVENLLYDNSSPRPQEELNAEIADTIVESLSPSPIPVEDSDSLREVIDIFTGTDDLLPPSIESDDYDSEGDIHFIEELLSNDSISLPENESSNFDHQNDPSFPRPPSEPPDVKFFFDFEPNSEELIAVVINNIDELIEDEYFDLGEVRVMFLQMLKMTITLSSFEFFYRILFTLRILLYFSPSVFVDLKISTQADGAQSLRVPVPFPEDPYEPSNSTVPLSLDHSLTHASPTLVPILCRTIRIATHVPPTMSPRLSDSIAEVAAMSDSTFRSRFRSFYESSPSSSSPELPSRKCYQEESSDSDSESEDVKDEGPTIEDKDPATGDEGLIAGNEGPNPEDDIAYIDVPAYPPPAPPVQTPLYLEWSSVSLHVSSTPSIAPSFTIHDTTDHSIACSFTRYG